MGGNSIYLNGTQLSIDTGNNLLLTPDGGTSAVSLSEKFIVALVFCEKNILFIIRMYVP